MNARAPRLTGVLADIARVADEEAAVAIARQFGGTRVYIPPRPRGDHWLTQLVGQEAANAIGEELTADIAGVRVDIPLSDFGHQASVRAQVDQMIAANASARDIALATGYTERGVWKRKAIKRDNDQADLFAPPTD